MRVLRYAERHIYPVLGEEPIGTVTTHVLPVEGMLAWTPNLGELLADDGDRAFVLHCLERSEGDPGAAGVSPHLLAVARKDG